MNKEVENFRRQGYTEDQIKNYYLQKGFNESQTKEMMYDSKPDFPNHKHPLIIPLLIILILVVAGNIYYFYFFTGEHYSDNPKNWIDINESVATLDVVEATKDEAFVDSLGNQQYKTLETSFTSEGWYKGDYFVKEYSKDNKVLMKITTDLVPNNNILEGYLIERMESDGLYAYIFLDSDWKKEFPNSKIYYGAAYENNISFDFTNEIKKGVFMTKVKDDEKRFIQGYFVHKGGFYVGDLRDDDFSTLMSYN